MPPQRQRWSIVAVYRASRGPGGGELAGLLGPGEAPGSMGGLTGEKCAVSGVLSHAGAILIVSCANYLHNAYAKFFCTYLCTCICSVRLHRADGGR